MFAQLGDMRFTVPAYFEGIEGQRSYTFAEHALIEGKPRLQWIGDELEQATVDMVFHVSFTQPELELARLRGAASRHEALPFVYGSGYYKGLYVVTELREVTRQTDGQGRVVAISARIALKEWPSEKGPPATVDPTRNEGLASGTSSARQSAPPLPTPRPAGTAPSSSDIVRR